MKRDTNLKVGTRLYDTNDGTIVEIVKPYDGYHTGYMVKEFILEFDEDNNEIGITEGDIVPLHLYDLIHYEKC